ncbi:MAG: TonB-dependent receptor [Bacteroidia bacterium]|nr:TonB-dependent receptor [Bacteroidia bacterium]
MVLRFFLSLLPLLLLASSAGGQTQYVSDDTLSFAYDEMVTVTAARLPVSLSHAPASVDVFDAASIASLPVSTLSDILSLTPGTIMRSYGPSGSLQLASMRGMGAEYTLVYLDGIRINDSQNATVDVGRLSLRGIERIEVVRGGFASLYGSNALGGVVNILSRRDAPPPNVHLGLGSFGWKLASVTAGISGRSGRLSVDAGYEEAENDYPVNPSWGGPTLFRGNASMQRRSIALGGTLLLGSAVLSVQADAYDTRVGVPGPLFSSDQGRARQDDTQLLLSTRLAMNAGGGTLTLGVGGRAAGQNYRDPAVSLNGHGLDARYDNTHVLVSGGWDGNVHRAIRIAAGVEAGLDHLRSGEVPGDPVRRQLAAYVSAECLLAPAGLPLHLYPSLRFDGLFDDPGHHQWSAFSPSLGLHFALLPERLALRLRAAGNFTAPTFNQLYWGMGGNNSLRPEHATTVDAGLHFRHPGLLRDFDITFFHHDITDKIVWMPGLGLWWSPRNVQHVVSEGIEVRTDLVLADDALTLRLGGQWISAVKENASFAGDATQGKQLVYVPRYSGTATLLARLSDRLTFSITQRVNDVRYYTETNDASLPAHAVLDVSAQLRLPRPFAECTLKTDVLNALDAAYEVIAFYPMPGRTVRITLITQF